MPSGIARSGSISRASSCPAPAQSYASESSVGIGTRKAKLPFPDRNGRAAATTYRGVAVLIVRLTIESSSYATVSNCRVSERIEISPSYIKSLPEVSSFLHTQHKQHLRERSALTNSQPATHVLAVVIASTYRERFLLQYETPAPFARLPHCFCNNSR